MTARPNAYAGTCTRCATHVAAGAGALGPKANGKWTVTCAQACSAPSQPATKTGAHQCGGCGGPGAVNFVSSIAALRCWACVKRLRSGADTRCAQCGKKGAPHARYDSSSIPGKVCSHCNREERHDLSFC